MLVRSPEYTIQMIGFLAKVVGVDNLGMWLENPNYHRVKVKDATGNPIAKVDQVEEELTAYLLIRWEYIDSIVTFPSNTDNETLANVNQLDLSYPKTASVKCRPSAWY